MALESAKEKEKEQQQQPTEGNNATGPTTTTADDMKEEKRHRRRTNTNAPSALRRQHAIIEIRRLITEGHSNEDVMASLGIPNRTFYRYLAQAYEHDSEMLRKQDRNALALEISVLKDRLCESYRCLSYIAGCRRYRTRDRIKAAAGAVEVAIAIYRVAIEGPLVLRSLSSSSGDFLLQQQ